MSAFKAVIQGLKKSAAILAASCLLLASGQVGAAEIAPAQHGSILFIDAGVENSQQLLSGVAADVSVIRLRRDADGVQQIAAALKDKHDLDSIQIISHGAPGRLQLGSTELNDANLNGYQAALQTWGQALNAQGGIRFMAVMSRRVGRATILLSGSVSSRVQPLRHPSIPPVRRRWAAIGCWKNTPRP